MSSSPLQSKRPCPSILDCAVCFEAYDINSRVPIIGTCGHTICITCRKRNGMLWRCPICQKMNAFVHEVKNFLVIQMIEEKLSEQKRQKTDHGCSLCQTSLGDADAHVCLGCVQKKDYETLDDLMTEVDSLSFKMCSRCVGATQKHDGHETHKLGDAKIGLYSMGMKLDVELLAKILLPRLDRFQNACEILNETYRELYYACMTNGQIGPESDFTALQKTISDDVLRLHNSLVSNTTSVWKLTNECLEVTEAVTAEKEKRRGRKFTAAEDSTFRALLAPTRDDSSDEEDESGISVGDWQKLTLEEKKDKALEMEKEESSDDEESEDEEDEVSDEDEEEAE